MTQNQYRVLTKSMQKNMTVSQLHKYAKVCESFLRNMTVFSTAQVTPEKVPVTINGRAGLEGALCAT